MSSMPTRHSVQELHQLITMLERSGIAEQRPEARALLLRSRVLLRERQRGPRRIAGKLATLATLAMDAAMLGLATMAVLLASSGEASLALGGLALPPAAWLALRLRHQGEALAEGARWVAYHLAWLYDWFAETLSLTAMERLEARIVAREVMSGWRRHRRSLPHRPGLEDVAAFLATAHGARAAQAFRQEAESLGRAPLGLAPDGAARRRAARRLAELRWSALIAIFARLARDGALWPDTMPAELARLGKDWPGSAGQTAAPPASIPTPAPPGEPADTAERAARRDDLRALIRRKRQDITTAFGWHLKTEAEISQRDNFLAQTRAEIAELERELAQLGG
ncbi:hypothetical protein KTR66_03655 [Roseococcus sp. SDR]|uniref:hypothetical protein n=1 Tax=Roseococcus sp. SDR TaxID=2835532 RepID=UPI001BCD2116|nr:hypothetical protein [Roseococcus sp. SDR]MBS7789075.1 hypothetical protein [Roseococcus sp. SDR]MBV1844389.1 hypothetical protein [Roseococcus sp. SDR]